jgi:NAD(P)-dependent dehydrogenase (short-subunit alcohol dehydrogenase family)
VADEHWLNVFDVDLHGTFWCASAFRRHMLKAGKGAILNVGSMSGFIVNRPLGQFYYNASNAAMHQLPKNLAAGWADRVCA